jgi:putative flippase GtrA
MALAQNRFFAPLWSRLRTKVGVRFTRFAGVAIASLATSEIALTLCNGVFHLSATPAAIIAWFAGAVVSYVLSRWAWERKGKPDVLRETVPFWVISAMVIVILTLATKFAYHAAAWMGLHGIKHVLFVDFIYLVANLCTFLLRFVLFHYVLFADRTTAARVAATGPDEIPPGTRTAPSPDEAPHSAAPAATAEATVATAAVQAETASPAPDDAGAGTEPASPAAAKPVRGTTSATRAARPASARSASGAASAAKSTPAAKPASGPTSRTRSAAKPAGGTTSAPGTTSAAKPASSKPATGRSSAKSPRGGTTPSPSAAE